MNRKLLKNHRFSLNERGVTLIELVVYIALTALLLIVNLGVLVNILRVRAETIQMQDLDFALNSFTVAFTQDLRWADSAIIYDGATESDAGTSLTVMRDSESITYRYDASNAEIIKTDVDSASYLISPQNVLIKNLYFENLAPPGESHSVKVTVEGVGTTELGNNTSTMSTAVTIRQKSASST